MPLRVFEASRPRPLEGLRRKIRSKTSLSARGRFILDAGLFAALVVASHPEWTGIGLHEWLAGIIVLPAIYHIAINWDWVVRVTSKLLTILATVSTANLIVDIVLFLATVTVMLSGVMVIPGVISTTDGTTILRVWSEAHRLSSYATVVAMLAHFLLHAEWITEVASRMFATEVGQARDWPTRPACTQPAETLMGRHSAPSRIGRRLKRTATNVAAVLLVTSIATTVIFAGIALYAEAEDNEIPPPTITAGAYDAAPPTGLLPAQATRPRAGSDDAPRPDAPPQPAMPRSASRLRGGRRLGPPASWV